MLAAGNTVHARVASGMIDMTIQSPLAIRQHRAAAKFTCSRVCKAGLCIDCDRTPLVISRQELATPPTIQT